MQREMFQLYLHSGKTQVIYQARNSISEAGIFMTEPYWSIRTGRKHLVIEIVLSHGIQSGFYTLPYSDSLKHSQLNQQV